MSDSEPSPFVFEMSVRVREEHIDVLGHVNNTVYVQWMQDVAARHWRAAASEAQLESLVWVVLRHEVDYQKPGFVGDQLLARTWVGSARGLRYERFVEVVRPADGARLIQARSEWCVLDRETLKPRRLRAEHREIFHRPPVRDIGEGPEIFARAGPRPDPD